MGTMSGVVSVGVCETDEECTAESMADTTFIFNMCHTHF